jgi:hypothetical protein
VVLFGISFKIFINTIYYQAENLRESYCRCDYYGLELFDEGKFGHSTVYILNTLSLFLSSVSFALLYARENLIITYFINLKFKYFDKIIRGEKKKLKATIIKGNDTTSKYKEYFKASLIQIGLVAALGDDKIFAWCTNNASIEINFFGLAGVFAGILGIYSLFKVIEKYKEPLENFDES